MAPHPLPTVVFDDDPTGSQTVHDCPLLLRGQSADLAEALAGPAPLLFVLTNSRALDPAAARLRLKQACSALQAALGPRDRLPWVVSRGDSTLRGHFPLEIDVIEATLGPFDLILLVPAFLEGGRTTVAGVHRLHGQPVHETAFARDGLFGYRHSFLPDWVAEKSGGRWSAAAVGRIDLAELDRAAAGAVGRAALAARLAALPRGSLLAVDAERPQQLAALAAVLRDLAHPPAGPPRRVLFQSAASLLNALADQPATLLPAGRAAALCRRDGGGTPLPGLVLVGSHVPLADAQLARLLEQPGCALVELPVARIQRSLEGPLPDQLLASLEAAWLEQLRRRLAVGQTPVLATSRGELACRHAAERRALGLALASLMARLAAALAPDLGYVISKGGITTHTLLADGLGLARVQLQGQIVPGLSLVLTPADAAVPGLPVVTFPGNLGDADGLVAAWRVMEGEWGGSGLSS
ncbi:MAG: four-carbon acid sugar kinase family protein [Cyanobacteriota bacterium]|nr:four-carbon acid sugar kinase family protein [Cyanobacteriota bacterium]